VTPLLLAAGAVVALGAAVAIGARDSRLAVIGLLVALTFAPFVADPLPALLPAAFSIVAGTLAAFLLLVAARWAEPGAPSPLGLAAAVVGAMAAFVAGVGAAAVGLPSFGPAGAVAGGLASAAVAAGSLALVRDPVRLGIAAATFLNAALLLRAGLVGTPPALEALLGGLSLVALAAAAVALTGATVAVGTEPGEAAVSRAGGSARARQPPASP
jgi:hypothetical protein